jgi:hypothetical protein
MFVAMSERDKSITYGPDNPHPLSRLKTELVWEGKYDEYGNRRPVKLPVSPLPLQRIETAERRASSPAPRHQERRVCPRGSDRQHLYLRL